MSLTKAVAEVLFDRVISHAVKTNAEIALQNAKKSGYAVFTWVRVAPHRRFRTVITGTCRMMFPLLGIFVLIPLPFFIFSNIASLLTSPLPVLIQYFDTFGLIYTFIFILSALTFVLLCFFNPHEKRSGLGIVDDYKILQITKSSIIVKPLQVTGITTFSWESVDSLVFSNRNDVLVLFIQPNSWWKRLMTYPGLRLVFSSSDDAQNFCNVGTTYIANLEANKAAATKRRSMSVVERERLRSIMYGPSDTTQSDTK